MTIDEYSQLKTGFEMRSVLINELPTEDLRSSRLQWNNKLADYALNWDWIVNEIKSTDLVRREGEKVILSNVNIHQGFSNFFSEGPDETPVQPERARTVVVVVFFFGGVSITSAKCEVPCGRGQGPWKLWGYWCSLMQSQPYFGPFTICLKPFFFFFYFHSNILCIMQSKTKNEVQ